jgi:hypothetical protein
MQEALVGRSDKLCYRRHALDARWGEGPESNRYLKVHKARDLPLAHLHHSFLNGLGADPPRTT